MKPSHHHRHTHTHTHTTSHNGGHLSWLIIIIINHHGLSAHRCPTPSSPNNWHQISIVFSLYCQRIDTHLTDLLRTMSYLSSGMRRSSTPTIAAHVCQMFLRFLLGLSTSCDALGGTSV